MHKLTCVVIIVLIGSPLLAQPAPTAPPQPSANKIRVALVTGGHSYDVKNFYKIYEGCGDLALDVRTDKDSNKIFDDITNFPYDVIVLYNFNNKITDAQKANFLALLARGVGLVVWHHALAAYPAWDEFKKIAGGGYVLKGAEKDGVKIPASGYKHDVKMKMHIEDSSHPITRGMSDFEIEDETYIRQMFLPDNHVLVSTDDPTSDKPIAWTRSYGKARIFSYQGGHDAKAWANDGQRKLWAQGVRWAAGKLE